MTKDMVGGKGHPGGEVIPYNCPLLGPLGFLALVTFSTWPMVPTLLCRSNYYKATQQGMPKTAGNHRN